MIFLFKLVECINAIFVIQFLYYEPMLWIFYSKLLSFCGNEQSLYPWNVIGIFLKLIFFRGDVFLNDRNNVNSTWIICARYMFIGNTTVHLILTSLKFCLVNISLPLQTHVTMLDRLDLIVTICDSRLMLSLDLNDGLLTIFLHLVYNLLSNMRKQKLQ